MNITDVVMKSRNVESFNNLLPVTSVTSEKSKAVASRNGYMAPYTADELRKKFHLTDDIIENLYYGCGFTPFYYWDKDKVIFPCNSLTMAADGEDKTPEIRGAVEQLKKKIASGNCNFIITALNDRMRIEYLKKLVDEGFDGAYKLFYNVYPFSDYGCSALGRDGILKLKSMKTPEQVQATEKGLRKYPDTLTVYRGAGDESASLEEAFSWTLDPAVAVFFATRFPSDHAKVYRATVEKASVIEYFEGVEAEVIVSPDDIKEVEDFPFYNSADQRTLIQHTDNCTQRLRTAKSSNDVLQSTLRNGEAVRGTDANGLALLCVHRHEIAGMERTTVRDGEQEGLAGIWGA